MDIYKLTDTPDGDLTKHKKYDRMEVEALSGVGVSGGELKITDIRQAVKNQNRVNVFVNDKYAFSLDIAQVVDLGVKKGAVITAEQLAEYKKASEFGKMYQRTLEWVLLRPRSVREVRDYIWRKLNRASLGTASRRPVFTGDARLRSRPFGSPAGRRLNTESELSVCSAPTAVGQQPPKDPPEALSELSRRIIERLTSKGYVDDEKFARWYVENRFVKKGLSMKRLKMELMKKGVNQSVIEEVLADSERDDETEIRKIVAKKRGKYDDEKLMAYLVRQGFSYDLVKKAMEDLGD
ncbi:RecX family transcriptional regulator [Candidatus Saccharibacteria bacterium]|nr:RecX family transcriptional regulator [Candidatus Saccharibacteria bacterium]